MSSPQHPNPDPIGPRSSGPISQDGVTVAEMVAAGEAGEDVNSRLRSYADIAGVVTGKVQLNGERQLLASPCPYPLAALTSGRAAQRLGRSQAFIRPGPSPVS